MTSSMAPFHLEQADCFTPIGKVSDAWRKNLLRHAKQSNDWQDFPTISSIAVAGEMLTREPLLIKLATDFGSFQRIFKFEPGTYYPFHTDGLRGAVVNLVLNEVNPGLTLFQISAVERAQFKVLELNYQKNVAYLFNTQVRHNSINVGRETRYLFSMMLGTEPVPYHQIRHVLGPAGPP